MGEGPYKGSSPPGPVRFGKDTREWTSGSAPAEGLRGPFRNWLISNFWYSDSKKWKSVREDLKL